MKLILTFLIMLYVQSTFAQRTIEVRADDWCPYTCDPKSGENGFIIDLAKKILESKGYKVSYKLLNWARSIKDTRLGKYDAIAGAAKSDAPDFQFPKEHYSWQKIAFFGSAKSTLKASTAQDFAGKKLGIINSYSYDDATNLAVEKKEAFLEIVSGDDGLLSLTRMVLDGRIDGFLENPAVFKTFAKKNGVKYEDFKILGTPKMDKQLLYIAFGPKVKDAAKLNTLIDQGIKALRKNGEYQKLLEKYNLED